MLSTTRRDFLKITGCLTIGFSLGGFSSASPAHVLQELPESLKRHPNINAWIEVLSDGRIRIFTGKLELGQGIRTAMAQVAAEELDVDIKNIEVILADTQRTPDEGYTAGSGSMEQSAMAIRYASAAAREKLLLLASQQLNVPLLELTITNGIIQTKTGNRVISFSALLDGKQITDEVREPVALKAKKDYRLVGKAVPRDDISLMVTGNYEYVQDLRFPGMVHARIIRPPAYTAALKKFSSNDVLKKVPGILKTIRNGNFLGVIAKEEYDAVQAQRMIRRSAIWSESDIGTANGETDLQQHIQKLPAESENVQQKGSLASSAFSHTAKYFKPYIMHGSIGPSCSVALWDQKTLHIWTHSQGVYPLREALSKLLHLPEKNIHVTGVPGSGCYGHNGADDVAADAALLALEYPGKHIRLQWSREDEHRWEPYGSAMIMEASANLDTYGKITGWKYELWSDDHSTRPGGNAENLLAARYIQSPLTPGSGGYRGGAIRNSQPYYSFVNTKIDAYFFKGPLRVSALRSLGAYANVFAIESFMEELAVKAGKDPYGFRIMHLDDQRAKNVLTKLRDITSGQMIPAGSAIGIAFARYKNSAAYCAVAALVHVNTSDGKVQVQKMWAVIDAGEVINTDGLINQTEGGMIQSASWTLKEQVKFDNKHITSSDWESYPIYRFSETPDVEVVVLNQPDEEPMGAGEAAQGPAAAAIANAVYYACSKRIRELPILPEKILNG
jgi:nicotinate dehydrogenase subunit B